MYNLSSLNLTMISVDRGPFFYARQGYLHSCKASSIPENRIRSFALGGMTLDVESGNGAGSRTLYSRAYCIGICVPSNLSVDGWLMQRAKNMFSDIQE